MTQTPNVIGIAVMQRLKELGEPATPENYERQYYEISGLPRPGNLAQPHDAAFYAELLATVREAVQEVADKTAHLAEELGEKNKGLSENVGSLRASRDKQEILRLLSTVVMQAGGIQTTVEISHRDLQETRETLSAMQAELA